MSTGTVTRADLAEAVVHEQVVVVRKQAPGVDGQAISLNGVPEKGNELFCFRLFLEKLLVFASGTARFLSGVSGWELARSGRRRW